MDTWMTKHYMLQSHSSNIHTFCLLASYSYIANVGSNRN